MIDSKTENGICQLNMNHGKVNAMDLEFNTALVEQLQIQARSACKAVVITGNARVFSAGVDLARVLEEDGHYMAIFFDSLVRLFEELFHFRKPLIAAVNGHAIAGGCVIAAACDHRLMPDEGVRIGIPELQVGVPFPAVAMEIMRRVVDPKRLPQVVFGAGVHTSEQALEWGLVDELTSANQLLDRALAVAKDYAGLSADVFLVTKQQLRQPALQRIENAQSGYEANVRRMWTSEAIRASIQRYVETTLRK